MSGFHVLNGLAVLLGLSLCLCSQLLNLSGQFVLLVGKALCQCLGISRLLLLRLDSGIQRGQQFILDECTAL